MAYTKQTFTTSQVLTSTQMNQVEDNISDHIHGVGGVTGSFGNTSINSALLHSKSDNLVFGSATVNSGTGNTFIGFTAAQSAYGSENTVIGASAGKSLTTGVDNTIIGMTAAGSLTTGQHNVAIGPSSLRYGQDNDYNVAIGASAMFGVQSKESSYCVGIGYQALYTAAGSGSVGIGFRAGATAVGTAVIAIGQRAFSQCASYSGVAIGFFAANGVTKDGTVVIGNSAVNSSDAPYCTVIGEKAVSGMTADLEYSTVIGYQAGGMGGGNLAIGYQALKYNTTSGYTGANSGNTAIGMSALTAIGNGGDNTAIGLLSQRRIVNGSRNVSLGNFTIYGDVADGTNEDEVAIGHLALYGDTSGIRNIGIGTGALYNLRSGTHNIGIGYYALSAGSNTNYNTAVGYTAISSLSSGNYNTAVGYESLMRATTAQFNTAVGVWSCRQTTGNGNTAVGYYAIGNTGYSYQAGNTGIGYNALASLVNSAAYNVALGYNAGSSISSQQNVICIGYNAQPVAAAGNHHIMLGDSNIANLYCYDTTIASPSDARDKTDIEDLELGLDFINQIRPVTFHWDRREDYATGVRDGTKKSNRLVAGFIAQELLAVEKEYNAEFLDLVNGDENTKLYAKYGKLLPVAIKAIQELSGQVNSLQAMVNSLVEVKSRH